MEQCPLIQELKMGISENLALSTEGALGRNLDPNDLRVTIAYLDIG